MKDAVYHRKPKYEDPSQDGKSLTPIPSEKPKGDVKTLNKETVTVKHNPYEKLPSKTFLRQKSKRASAMPK